MHDQPLTDTQRMTHLQRALDGNAKKAIGGMLTHGHLYREALKELEEQFGNEEAVAGAYLKTIFDHPEVPEDNFAQLRSFYNTLHVAVSTLKTILRLQTTSEEQSKNQFQGFRKIHINYP